MRHRGNCQHLNQSARALDVLKSAKKPLIILGKGAAYAQVDQIIKDFVEKSGVPYLPMSMAKGLLLMIIHNLQAPRVRWF